MFLTKIVVLVAHDAELDVEKFCKSVDYGTGQQIEEDRLSGVFYEVRHESTKEVTLASVDFSLEQRAPLMEAMESEPEVTGNRV